MTNTLQGLNYRWELPVDNSDAVRSIAAQYNLSFPIAHVLATRGIISHAQLDEFLFSSLEKDVPHPREMADAEKAVDRILLAIERKEKILVAGDYDVDGVTATALLVQALEILGANVRAYIPNRFDEGYGLNPDALDSLKAEGSTIGIQNRSRR